MNAAEEMLRRIIGEICWGVSYDRQLNLSLNFGEPHLRIRDPRPNAKSPSLRRRGVTPSGTWWLWVRIARWQLEIPSLHSVSGTSSIRKIGHAIRELEGECLSDCEVARTTGKTVLTFDAGSTLRISRFSKTDEDDLWTVYGPNGISGAVNAQGGFSVERSGEQQK